MSRPKGRAERGTIVEDEPNLKIIMANTKREKLFTEFPPVPTEKWEEVIAVDLKGADYERKLVWRTPEGLSLIHISEPTRL